MKKHLIPLIICVLTGLTLGKIMFNQYQIDTSSKVSASPSAKVYFFQVGVYSKLENLKSAQANYTNSIYIKQDDKYYLFVGMTKDEENVSKLKNYFDELTYDIYVKEIEVSNSGFLENLSQYDMMLKNAKTIDEIKNINDAIIAKYEELVING